MEPRLPGPRNPKPLAVTVTATFYKRRRKPPKQSKHATPQSKPYLALLRMSHAAEAAVQHQAQLAEELERAEDAQDLDLGLAENAHAERASDVPFLDVYWFPGIAPGGALE